MQDPAHHGMKGSYRGLMIELAIDFVIMYLVMYTMIATLDHFYLQHQQCLHDASASTDRRTPHLSMSDGGRHRP
jgi:hypothetical protein